MSYYPNLMINLKIFPEHLSEKFLNLFERIVKERLEDKKAGRKLEADAKKILINSIYGKLNFEYGWLMDTKASYSVTLNGQLFLLMLIEKLSLAGIPTYYANTDGISVKLYKGKEKEFERICKEFEEFINISLEFADYEKCVIRDVNNYTIKTKSGKIKEKGAFLRYGSPKDILARTNYNGAYDKPIVAEALYEYFHNNVPIEETIKNHSDIYDFCSAQKIGSQFTTEIHQLNSNKTELEIIPCQKTNRYFITNDVSKFYKKRKDNGRLNDLASGYYVKVFNDYNKQEYNINYRYYISVTQKIIDILEPKQLNLF